MLVNAKSTKQYDELMTQYKDYIDTIDSLYKLNTNEEEKISDIYSKIKANLIETNIITPSRVIKIISNACCYNSRFKQSYISLAIKFFNEYHPTSIAKVPVYFDYFVFKEHGIIFSEKNKYKISTYKESELYKAIIEDDAKLMSSIIDNEEFDSRKFIKSILNPNPLLPGFLFELVCYHGAVNCFKLLITKYHPRISQFCLEYSFRSGSPDITNECLKYQTPDYRCMMHAVKSHNIDFITFLKNEHGIDMNLVDCCKANNLEALFVYMDQTNDMVKSFIYSASFNMPSLCKYFIEQSPDILTKYGDEALQNAAKYGCLETAKFLLSKGAKFTENRHSSLELAVKSGNIEVVDLFLNKGAVLSKRISKECLYLAIKNCQKDMVQFLFSHGVEISNGNRDDESSLQSAAFRSTP